MGGLRSSAQMISYELTLGLSALSIILLTGSLSLVDMVKAQETVPFILIQPLAFLLFFIAGVAETNRAPFDLPEAEQELVAGFHTEYTGMKFAMFFMGEYAAMIAVSAMMVILFLGGWTLPFAGLNEPATSLGMGLVQMGIFIGKLLLFMGLFIWIRWMLPRFRYDRLMDLGWKCFIPLALANIVVTAIYLFLTIPK